MYMPIAMTMTVLRNPNSRPIDTPEDNSIVKRGWRTCDQRAVTWLAGAQLTPTLWRWKIRITNHQGHEVSRRNRCLGASFVCLRALRGNGFCSPTARYRERIQIRRPPRTL